MTVKPKTKTHIRGAEPTIATITLREVLDVVEGREEFRLLGAGICVRP